MRHLTERTTRGTVAVKTYRRARALLALPAGHAYTAVAAQLGVRYAPVSDGANAYAATGWPMLVDTPRSGRPLLIQASERAKLTALACSPAPDGRGQWRLRLLAGKAGELGLCARLSARSAHAILRKTSSSPS